MSEELFTPVQTVEDAPTENKLNALVQVIQAEHIEAGSALEIQTGFAPFFAEADEWRVKALAIKVTDVSQKADMALARVIRLKLKEIRVNANKKREALKENSLRYGKAVQGAYNILEFMVVPLEKSLEEAEKFAEVQEAKRQAELKTSREIQLTPWKEFVPFGLNLGVMTEEDFQKVLSGAKLQHQAKIDAEAKAEQERQERIKAEEAEREKVRLENERLKAEAVEKEKQLAAERAKAEAKAKEEEKARAKLQAENDAKLRAEREAREKIESELRAKAEAEEAEKRRQLLAAEEAKKATDDVKLLAFADFLETIEYPEVSSVAAREAIDKARSVIANVSSSVRARAGQK